MAKRPARYERRVELLARTFTVSNGERCPLVCVLEPGLSLEQAVLRLVADFVMATRGPVNCHDFAIWRRRRLVAVSRRKHGEDVITLLEED